ncbi:MAG: acyltransferase [Bacteroidota bacterium]
MKRHYEILDGLRGTAALLVVVFHLLEARFPDPALNPMHHAFLAVDFFYLLSGFVVGYAYDDRMAAMGIAKFLRTRLIRLHPLVILGVLIGAIGYWFDPFAQAEQPVTFPRLLLSLGLGILLIPAPDLPNRYGETHSLNGPCWSLLQEYIANIIYALVGLRLGKPGLWLLVITSGLTLLITAAYLPNLGTGWGWENIWIAPIRMMFPFFAGLLLYRTGLRIKIPFAYPLLSLLLLIIFCAPTFTYNGLAEAACIILVFPLVVAAGAGGHVSGRWAKLSAFSGRISYPIYILHYPFIYIFTHWFYAKNPAVDQFSTVAAACLLFFVALAWVALRLYDEPVRSWLKRKLAA